MKNSKFAKVEFKCKSDVFLLNLYKLPLKLAGKCIDTGLIWIFNVFQDCMKEP